MDWSGPIYFVFNFFKINTKKIDKKILNPTQNVFLSAMQTFKTALSFSQFEQHIAKDSPLRG